MTVPLFFSPYIKSLISIHSGVQRRHSLRGLSRLCDPSLFFVRIPDHHLPVIFLAHAPHLEPEGYQNLTSNEVRLLFLVLNSVY